jgi:hypothetical protein
LRPISTSFARAFDNSTDRDTTLNASFRRFERNREQIAEKNKRTSGNIGVERNRNY